MNKIPFFILFTLYLPSIGLTERIGPQVEYSENVGPHALSTDTSNSCNEKLTQLLAITDEQSKKLFGYNPALEILLETDPTVQNPHEITIVPHGFGGSKENIRWIKQDNSARLPGTIIMYNCPEIADGVMQLGKANFGQLPDMRPMLYILAQCQKITDRIHLRGFSRAGAIIVNCVAALVDYKKYEKEFQALNITAADAQAILKMIQRGSIVFECPLTHLQATIEKKMRPSIFILAPLVALIANYLAPLATNYKPLGEHAITSAQILAKNNIRLKVLIHTEKNDTFVYTHPEFLQLFQQTNSEHTYESIGNRDHNHRDPQFYTTLNTFNKKYNAAYSPRYLVQSASR